MFLKSKELNRFFAGCIVLLFIASPVFTIFSRPTQIRGEGAFVDREGNKIKASQTSFQGGYYLRSDSVSIFTAYEKPKTLKGALVAIGDLNGDGRDDLVVTKPNNGIEKKGEGVIYIIYSYQRSDVNLGSQESVENRAHLIIYGNITHESLGGFLIVKDLNNDGCDDLIISGPNSPLADGGSVPYGELFIVMGRVNFPHGIIPMDRLSNFTLKGDNSHLHMGRAAAVGDFNGDGIKDVAVSSDLTTPYGELNRGEVFFIFGNGTWRGVKTDLAAIPAITGSLDNENLGLTMAADDFDHDGIDDLAMSSDLVKTNGLTRTGGGVRLLKGGEYLKSSSLSLRSSDSNITIYTLESTASLGKAFTFLDINGDGYMDLTMGAPTDVGLGGAPSAGAVYVFFGMDFPIAKTYLSTDQSDIKIMGVDSSDMFGSKIVGGDLDGDGKEELIVSAPSAAGEYNGKPFSGEIMIFSSLPLLSVKNHNASEADMILYSSSYFMGSSLEFHPLSSSILSRGVLGVICLGGAPSNMVEKLGKIIVLKPLSISGNTFLGSDREKLGVSIGVGDFNGDGIEDLVVGAPHWSATSLSNPIMDCGAVYVFYNITDFHGITDLLKTKPDISIFGPSYSNSLFGEVIKVGDLNGDGIDDIISGARLANYETQWNAGRVYVIFGNHSLPGEIHLSGAGDSHVTLFYGYGYCNLNNPKNSTTDYELGTSIGVGDLDGDGIDDLLMGGPKADITYCLDNGDQTGYKIGEIFGFWGRENWPYTIVCKPQNVDIIIAGERNGEMFSSGDIMIYDINRDGYGDVIVGTPTATYRSIPQSGLVNIIWGMNRTQWKSYKKTQGCYSGLEGFYDLAKENSTKIGGRFRGDILGKSITITDLIEESGVEKALVIGAPGSDGQRRVTPNSGAVYILPLSNILQRNTSFLITSIADITIWGDESSAEVGSAISSGDADGDGINDLALGAPGALGSGNSSLNRTGEVYIAPAGYLKENTSISVDALPGILPPMAGGEFGFSVILTDVNHDGYHDLITGAPMSKNTLGLGGAGAVFYGIDPLKNHDLRTTYFHPLKGTTSSDDVDRTVLFPYSGKYKERVDVNLPPVEVDKIDYLKFYMEEGEKKSYINYSLLTQNITSNGTSSYQFTDDTIVETSVGRISLEAVFNVSFLSAPSIWWLKIELYNKTGDLLFSDRTPVRWVVSRQINISISNSWKSNDGSLTGDLPWIPPGRDLLIGPIKLVYSSSIEFKNMSVYEPTLITPSFVLGVFKMVDGELYIELNASGINEAFNITISFTPKTPSAPLVKNINLFLTLDGIGPFAPLNVKVYPNWPDEEESVYDGDGSVYITFNSGWDPWGPSEHVETHLKIMWRDNSTLFRMDKINSGTWIKLPEGNFQLLFYSVDLFLNPSESVIKNLTVDYSPLHFYPLSPTPTKWVNEKNVIFSVGISSGPSGVLPSSVHFQIHIEELNISTEWMEAKYMGEKDGMAVYKSSLPLPDGTRYSLRWMAYSKSMQGPYYSPSYFFSVDTTPPEITDFSPSMDQIVGGEGLILSASIRDSLSYLNLSTAAFRFSTERSIMDTPWKSFNLSGFTQEIVLKTPVNLTFVGAASYQFKVMDRAGNWRILSPVPITIDLSPPVFINSSLPTGSVVNSPSITISIDIYDSGGVDLTSIKYAYSNPSTWTELGIGIYGFSNWMDVEDVKSKDPLSMHVVAKANIPLVEGEFNYLKWYAKDKAGNGAESSFFRFTSHLPRVNHAPLIYITFPIDRSIFSFGTKINFLANGSDPDGDNLTYRWYSNRSGFLGEDISFNRVLESGVHHITLKVSDGLIEVQKSVNITVRKKEVSGGEKEAPKTDVFSALKENPWVILLILIPSILIGFALGFILSRHPVLSSKVEEESVEGSLRSPFITPPPKKYYCIECGGEVRMGDEYCIHCGHIFTEEDWKKMEKGVKPKKKKKEGAVPFKGERIMKESVEEVPKEDMTEFMRGEGEFEVVEEPQEFGEVEELGEFEEVEDEWEED